MVCVLPINLNANLFTHFISKLLESFENYARKFWSTCNRRMKNLFVQMKKFWLRQEQNLLSTTKYKCLHVWQRSTSMATLEVLSDTTQTKHYRRNNSVHWNSGAATTISSINFDRFSYRQGSKVFIENLCDWILFVTVFLAIVCRLFVLRSKNDEIKSCKYFWWRIHGCSGFWGSWSSQSINCSL